MTKIQLQYDFVRPLTDADSKRISDGAIHGFFNMAGLLDTSKEAMTDAGAALFEHTGRSGRDWRRGLLS